MIEEVMTGDLGIGTSVRKCLVRMLHVEPRTNAVWIYKLHVAVELGSLILNITVLGVALCEI